MPTGHGGGMRLRIVKDGRVVRAYRVKPETFTIGSGKESTIRAPAATGLAPTHALVWLQEGVPVLVPSPGCTVEVNGEPVSVAQLGPDDVVTLGRLHIQIEGIPPGEGLEAPPTVPDLPLADDEPTAVSPRPAPPQGLAEPQLDPPAAPGGGGDPAFEETTEVATPRRMEARALSASRVPTKLGAWPAAAPPRAAPPPPVAPPPDAAPAAAREADPARGPADRDVPRPEPLAPPSAPSPLRVGFADDLDLWEDDEDDETDFVEPFSLTDHLEQVGPAEPEGARERYVVAQVVRHSEGRLWDVSAVLPGTAYAPTDGEPPLLALDREGACRLFVTRWMTGAVWMAGREAPLTAMLDEPGRGGVLRLAEGDRALINTPDARFIVQLLRPPRPGPPRLVQALTSASVLALYAVAVLGVVGGAAFLLEPLYRPSAAPQVATDDIEDPVWNRGPVLIAPPPEAEPPIEPEPVETPSAETPASPESPPSTVRRPLDSGGVRGGGRPSPIKSLLENLAPSGGSGALGQAITSIDALPSDSPGSSPFRVGGVIGKLPGGEVSLGVGGGPRGPVKTLGIGAIREGTPGIGGVEGTGRELETRDVVTEGPTKRPPPPTIDHAAVRRVVDRHMQRIRRCYESRLLDNPTLSGRLAFVWTIDPEGRVSRVSVRSSSLRDPSVATCITGIIRGMTFPRPQGGSVAISYPFVFRAVDR